MRYHQKMCCHFEIEFMQKLIEGTEYKPLRFSFKNNNVAVPFVVAFTQVNNTFNHSNKDDAPLLTYYTQILLGIFNCGIAMVAPVWPRNLWMPSTDTLEKYGMDLLDL